MQGDLISHLNGLFHGKRRKTEAVITPLTSADISAETTLFSERIKNKFRRKSEPFLEIGIKDGSEGEDSARISQNSKGILGGFGLFKIAKLDFKLNLKKLNISGSPPELPVRHFSTSSDEDLPPPIPVRKCSLDNVLDEEFEGRFAFCPLSTIPLPDEFSSYRKIYPSRTPRSHAPQRPPSLPPPPPPPPPTDASVTQNGGLNQASQTVAPASSTLHQDAPGFSQPLTLTRISESQNQNSHVFQNNDVPDLNSYLPPPPARLPPPPPLKSFLKMSASSCPSGRALVSENTSSETSSPQSTPQRPKPLSLPATQSHQAFDSNLPPSTPPFLPPPPPSFTSPPTKTKLANGTSYPAKSKSALKNAHSKVAYQQAFTNYSDVPLPIKIPMDSVPSSSSTVAKRLPPVPPIGNKIVSINGMKTVTTSYPILPQEQQRKLPPITTSPLPAPPSRSMSSLPPPLQATSTMPASPPPLKQSHNFNKNRPLPSLPVSTPTKSTTPGVKSGWGGQEFFDPREEEGDLYDVMDSTNM